MTHFVDSLTQKRSWSIKLKIIRNLKKSNFLKFSQLAHAVGVRQELFYFSDAFQNFLQFSRVLLTYDTKPIITADFNF